MISRDGSRDGKRIPFVVNKAREWFLEMVKKAVVDIKELKKYKF